MVYHACYEVNYKSNEIITKIIILRYKCKKCDVTHALKPEFLASRHQYDTLERQKYVLQYNNVSKGRKSLRELCCQLFPSILVSHTVMYYWIRVATTRKDVTEPFITKEIQEYLPSWAGLSPGNLESAGEKKHSRSRNGNSILKATLRECAWAASMSRNTRLSARYWNWVKRLGEKKALIAVAHTMLRIIYFILLERKPYEEMGPEYLESLKIEHVERKQKK